MNSNSCTLRAGKTKHFYTQWRGRFAYFKKPAT